MRHSSSNLQDTTNARRTFLKTSSKFGISAIATAATLSLGTNTLAASSQKATSTSANTSDIAAALKSAQSGEKIPAMGYAVRHKNDTFKPFTFSRHVLGENDVLIEILYAGICHSDIHAARSEWRDGIYPMVPGHEIAGRVVAIGKKVSKFKVGDYAGVGCMVNSCGECESCKKSYEQFCENGKTVFTYDSIDVFHQNEPTYGGYSNNIVLSEKFAIKVPQNAPLDKVAPLLCAGITTYSPLRFSNVKKGDKVGVAGFGGLGVMALKYAIKMGAEVSVFARNRNKEKDALKLGAKTLYTSDKLGEIKERFDFIISTIPTKYNPFAYVNLLRYGGEMAIVGLPPTDEAIKNDLTRLCFLANRKVYGSMIGGIKETQEMLDFSLKHKIYPETEIIKVSQINEAYENLTSGKAKFRYVIDMKSLQS